MNSEIAILFRRSAIKYSFQKNLLLLCLPERIVVLEKKNSGFLWQEFLKLRFCSQYLWLNILSRRTLCFIARWKELSFLKKNSRFLSQEFLKLQFYPYDLQLDIIFRRTIYFIACWKEFSFLRKEFPVLVARVSEIEIHLKILRCRMHSYHQNSLFCSIFFQEPRFSLKESPLKWLFW